MLLPPHAVAARQNYVKLNHPVVMIFSCVGDGTPRCVNVQSAGQMSVKPFFGCTIKFWWQNSVPPARERRSRDAIDAAATSSRDSKSEKRPLTSSEDGDDS